MQGDSTKGQPSIEARSNDWRQLYIHRVAAVQMATFGWGESLQEPEVRNLAPTYLVRVGLEMRNYTFPNDPSRLGRL